MTASHSLKLSREIGHRRGEASALNALALVAIRTGDLDLARHQCDE